MRLSLSSLLLLSSLQVSLFNYVFLASWAFALPYSQYRPLASSVCTVWTCVIIVCKMLYQLKSINPPSYSKNCSMVNIIRTCCLTRVVYTMMILLHTDLDDIINITAGGHDKVNNFRASLHFVRATNTHFLSTARKLLN